MQVPLKGLLAQSTLSIPPGIGGTLLGREKRENEGNKMAANSTMGQNGRKRLGPEPTSTWPPTTREAPGQGGKIHDDV